MQATPQRREVEATDGGSRLAVGTAVCVWNQFLGRWSSGFTVAEIVAHGYRLRRRSDGHVFGDMFPAREVMQERRSPHNPHGSHLVDRRSPIADDAPHTSGTEEKQ